MNWLTDDVELWEPSTSNAFCPPSAEVLEMIERIHEFVPEGMSPPAEPVVLIASEAQKPIESPEPPQVLSVAQERDLQSLRRWYAIADSLERPPNYLERIKELAQGVKQEQSLSDKAITAMQGDVQQYQTLSAQLVDDARNILQRRGETTNTGARAYSGKNYTIGEHQGFLSVRSQDRGVILEIQDANVTTLKLQKQDFVAFHDFSHQQSHRMRR